METESLAPLAMSQTKDDLLKYLNMSPETYSMMAKEADKVYKQLTSEKRHLKKNCKRKPPHDWSDIVEKSKDEAMRAIAHGGTPHTNYYWNLGEAASEANPNWVARWFLYHKFRYRDGRNRNAVKGADGTLSYSSSKHTHHRHSGGEGEYATSYDPTPYHSGSYGQASGYGYESAGVSTSTIAYAGYRAAESYENAQAYRTPAEENTSQGEGQESGSLPYDPVRDQ